MRILVLGGTQMLGRDFVERYMGEHSIVLANRGVTGAGLFTHLEHVRIDRNINAADKFWELCPAPPSIGPIGCRLLRSLDPVDAVVDFSAYTVQHLENTMPFLPGFSKYIFISTTCVNGLTGAANMADAFESYCFNKRECENWLKMTGISHSILRPCVVAGENDYTGRFISRNGKCYWKQTGEEAGIGTVSVSNVSLALMHLCISENNLILNLCR
jgi:nucleoside-diphosphate-sugar epimerase